MKIVLACSQFPPTKSGYARIAFELSRWFSNKGHDVKVITESKGCSRIGKMAYLNNEGKSILDEGCDILQIIGPTPIFTEQCLTYAKKKDMKVVYTINALPGLSSFYDYFGTSIIDGLYEKAYLKRKIKAVDLAVFNTGDFAKSCDFYDGAFAVIPYGFNECDCTVSRAPRQESETLAETNLAYHGNDKETLRILFVGQLKRCKGVQYLLSALKQIRDKGYKGVTARIVGEGPDKHNLTSMIKSLGLDNSAFLLGGLGENELHTAYLRSDVIVLPSIAAESFGIVLVEGAAHRLKVVASDLAGVRELVSELDGVVVPPKNSRALAEALIEILSSSNNPYGAHKLPIEYGIEKRDLSKFLWEHIALDYLGEYERLLNAASAESDMITVQQLKYRARS